MAVRAYKLIEVKCEQEPTFSLNEIRIVSLAEDQSQDIINFQKSALEGELEEVKAEMKDPENSGALQELGDVETTLETMIKECEDEDYVEYYCY